jgi:hypothetical protein
MKKTLKKILVTILSVLFVVTIFPSLKVKAATTDLGTYTVDLTSGSTTIPNDIYIPRDECERLAHTFVFGISWLPVAMNGDPYYPCLYLQHYIANSNFFEQVFDLDLNGSADVVFLYDITNQSTVATVCPTNSCSGTFEFKRSDFSVSFASSSGSNFAYYKTVRFTFSGTSSDNSDGYGNSLNNLVNNINNGSGTITFTEGSALSKKVMKALANNPNVTLNFVFEHDGVKYDILIPGKEFAKYYDESIEWYGHLWLSGHFGNRAK